MILHPNKKFASGNSIFICFLVAFFLSSPVFGQERVITGSVISALENTPLPGASVVIKGTTEGTISDENGNFSISANEGDVLHISYIGYLDEEVAVGSEINYKVSLIENITNLNDLIVIGYSTQKKKLVTGATTQLKGEDLEKRNSTTTLEAMQGQTPGVNITSTSGQPGEGMKVTIRGLGTIGDASPLYIVDGMIIDNIDYLNPADIESIDVLKDAASAAIYGSRGGNGVVIVTTRKGSVGKAHVSFDAYYGVQNRPVKQRTLNAREYAGIINEQHLNSGGSSSSLPFDISDLPSYTKEGSADNDWLNEMFVKNAPKQNYVLGVNGGKEGSIYSTSLSYTNQEGIVGGRDLSYYERYSFRFNSEHSLYNKRVTIGQNLTFSNIEDKGIAVGNQYDNDLRQAFQSSPLIPMYNDNGDYFNTADKSILDQFGNPYWFDQEANPYAQMLINNQNIGNSQRLVGNVYTEIKILENLKFRSSAGVNYFTDEERRYNPIYELSVYARSTYDRVSQRMEKGFNYIWDNILTYTYNKDIHNVIVIAGTSIQEYKGSRIYGENSDLAFDDLQHAYLDNATNSDNTARMKIEGAPHDKNKMLSYFSRVQYDLKETYLFNATFRADGSSKFAKENRWGYFPSVSAGWIITNESFMSSATNVMPFFKIRASWGQNGNSNLEPFNYLAPIRFTNANYNFGESEGENTVGSYPSRLQNEELKWETSEQLNFGFDSRFIKNKLTVNFDWYQKITRDWLIKAPILATAGTDAPWINGGNVKNTGVELALTYKGNASSFKYSINLYGAYNKNIVTDIPTDDGIIHGATNTLYNNGPEFYRAESGYPIGYFWGLETDGIFQTTSEVNQHQNSEGTIIQPNAEPGDVRYIDQNDDGELDDNDKVNLGDPNPDLTYGLTFSCDYKGIDFMIVTYGVWGNQIVQSYRNHTNKYANYTTAVLDRWTGPGTSNTIPRVTNQNINYKHFSNLYMQEGAFYRIGNITLGYDLARILSFQKLEQFRLYASVQNLYTFTNYDGMDPEVGYGFDNGEDDKFSSGIDLGYYPRPRTYLLGIKVLF